MNPNRKLQVSIKRSRGVTLVESLVALIVLSIGMLGIAAMYVESLRSGKSALTRTQAVMLVSDMADRIRANSSAFTSYQKTANATGTVTAACNGSGGTCTPANMAANDIAIWHAMVDDRNDDPASGRLGLPEGRGTITLVPGVPQVLIVAVSWREGMNPDGTPVTASYSLRIRQ